MHSFYRVLPLVLVALSGLLWLIRRKAQELTPDLVMRQMHRSSFEGLEKYLDQPTSTVDIEAFKRDTGGYTGLWRRWRNARGCFAICQYGVEKGIVDHDELVLMRLAKRRLRIESCFAAMEFALVPRLDAGHALAALRSSLAISQQMYAVAAGDDFPISATTLERFL